MLARLQTALNALRYDPTTKVTVRINLLFCIKAHAMMCADDEMREACDAEITKIRSEMTPPAAPVPPAPDAPA